MKSNPFTDVKIAPCSMHNFCILQWGVNQIGEPKFSIAMPQDAAEFILDASAQLTAAVEREDVLKKVVITLLGDYSEDTYNIFKEEYSQETTPEKGGS